MVKRGVCSYTFRFFRSGSVSDMTMVPVMFVLSKPIETKASSNSFGRLVDAAKWTRQTAFCWRQGPTVA